jgi:hypothetical protein
LLQDRSSYVKKITPRVRCANANTRSLEDGHANRML